MSASLHRLANGITVAIEPMDGVETLAVGLYADVGARSEPEGLSGLAHMVEHMVFKGAGNRDARAIAEDIEDVGGSLNAWTARDHTVFHGRLLAGDLALGVGMIADLVRAPHFDADELEREKGVVLSELGEARDTPDDIVFDHLQLAAFPRQPLGRPVLGDEASIAAIDADALRAWVTGQYRPDGLVLAAAGKVDEAELLRLAEAYFGDMAPGAPATPPAASFAAGAKLDRRRFDQIHLALGWRGVGYRDPAVHALSLFTTAAGGGMSSRLFQELREQRGLAYSVYAWAQSYAETGLFGVYCAAQRDQGAEALALAEEVLARTAEGLTEAELERARVQAKAGLLMGLEGPAARCDHLARQIQVHGRIVPVAETVAALDAVNLAAAREAGARALSGGRAIATVGGKLAKAA
ncbi:M16 family metallopeptidase [Edaphosphingomonas haloaromaticamans]|uniref:Protease 3 n=1 Tax=Edaphosphingomonas haloaromaticamans TaxID=653954 RepID=A0A1S1HA59_9SPHN|nr:pitrilysin family protein [Sphingomonas haloaromaticamans]OHT19007.1 Protease 3 precursor [Sphingomonas haloaromaticamans]